MSQNENFVAKYPLVDASEDILREELPKFDFLNPPIDQIGFAYELTEHMLYYNGLGLAANQLGLPYRAFAIRSEPVLVCYNLEIVDSSPEEVLLDEGCLTFPNLFFKVKRRQAIKVRYQEPNGEFQTKVFSGMTARAIQHENDHLDGVLFIDRVSNLVLDLARKKSKKYERQLTI